MEFDIGMRQRKLRSTSQASGSMGYAIVLMAKASQDILMLVGQMILGQGNPREDMCGSIMARCLHGLASKNL